MIGKVFDFYYDNNFVSIEILDFYTNKKNKYLKCKYKDNVTNLNIYSFKNARLKSLIGTNSIYKYNIDDIVEVKTGQIKIIEQISIYIKSKNCNQKGYKYICLNDGVEGLSLEANILKGEGCSVCVNQRVVKGVNDIATTHPWLVEFFVNPEDAYNNVYGTDKKMEMICPKCGTKKMAIINNIIKNGFSCSKCGDKISNPQKIMYYMLDKSLINFETEKTFSWSYNRRYDFYIQSLNCIIETHGLQHYKYTGRGKSLEEEQENDRLKERLAKENGIENYIVIDCSQTNIDQIFNNIINNKEIKRFINSENFNIIDVYKYCSTTLIEKICLFWKNNKPTVKEMSDIFKLDCSTIIKYLRHGSKLGWCNYLTKAEQKRINFDIIIEAWNNGNHDIGLLCDLVGKGNESVRNILLEGNEKGLCDYSKELTQKIAIEKSRIKKFKKIICINTNEVFNSLQEACDKYDILKSTLSNCLKGKNKATGGKSNKKQLIWMYYDEYIKLSQEEIEQIKKEKLPKEVICLNTKEIFDSANTVANKYNINLRHVWRCCNGEMKFVGIEDNIRLRFIYYEDYLRQQL